MKVLKIECDYSECCCIAKDYINFADRIIERNEQLMIESIQCDKIAAGMGDSKEREKWVIASRDYLNKIENNKPLLAKQKALSKKWYDYAWKIEAMTDV